VLARVYGAVVSIAVVLAVAWPLTLDPRKGGTDDFPLSTYPMFARPRSTTMTMTYAVGITAGAPRPLRPSIVGSREVLQARALIDRAANGGPAARRDFCRSVATRVAAARALRDVTHVALVRGTHDAIDLLVYGRRGPEKELERCPVERGSP
jgi:hypothetical protein